MMKMLTGFVLGVTATAVASLLYGGAEIKQELLSIQGSVEFCEKAPFTLWLQGSRLSPRIAIECPTSPCAGMMVFDSLGTLVHAMVSGVPIGTDCGTKQSS